MKKSYRAGLAAGLTILFLAGAWYGCSKSSSSSSGASSAATPQGPWSGTWTGANLSVANEGGDGCSAATFNVCNTTIFTLTQSSGSLQIGGSISCNGSSLGSVSGVVTNTSTTTAQATININEGCASGPSPAALAVNCTTNFSTTPATASCTPSGAVCAVCNGGTGYQATVDGGTLTLTQ